ncbi:MAG: GatB/YqeY domain-containing protein [bacterium]
MDLISRLSEDQKAAMKSGDGTRLALLRLLRTRIREAEVEKRSNLSDEDLYRVIQSEVKRRKEAIELFEKGGRGDLAKREKEEIAILESYLPEKVSEDEIVKEATRAIEDAQASGPQDFGKVMKILMPKLVGKADGSVVSKIVRDLLAKKSS